MRGCMAAVSGLSLAITICVFNCLIHAIIAGLMCSRNNNNNNNETKHYSSPLVDEVVVGGGVVEKRERWEDMRAHAQPPATPPDSQLSLRKGVVEEEDHPAARIQRWAPVIRNFVGRMRERGPEYEPIAAPLIEKQPHRVEISIAGVSAYYRTIAATHVNGGEDYAKQMVALYEEEMLIGGGSEWIRTAAAGASRQDGNFLLVLGMNANKWEKLMEKKTGGGIALVVGQLSNGELITRAWDFPSEVTLTEGETATPLGVPHLVGVGEHTTLLFIKVNAWELARMARLVVHHSELERNGGEKLREILHFEVDSLLPYS